jgi:hypothetical protein
MDLVQPHHAAEDCTSKWRCPEGALGGLANRREGGDEDVVEGLAGGSCALNSSVRGPQRFVGKLFELGLQGVDGGDLGPVRLQRRSLTEPKDFLCERAKHRGAYNSKNGSGGSGTGRLID